MCIRKFSQVKKKSINLYFLIKGKIYYRFIFKEFGQHSKIIKPLSIISPERIVIEDHVTINKDIFLCSNQQHNKKVGIIIGSGSTLGHYNHIVGTNYLKIGKNVLTADKVFITDSFHCFADINKPIMFQGVSSKRATIIGDGTWIGENVSIISCEIGKNCIIGANSVVVNDIPDYCVAAGNPARIIKKYNKKENVWKKVEKTD